MIKSAAAAGTKTAEIHGHSTTSVSSSQDDENIDPDECEEMEIDETAMNYNFAMKEVILNELNSGKLPYISITVTPILLQSLFRFKQCLPADETVNGATTLS